MPARQPSRRRLRTLCAEVHPDDGSDPRYFFRTADSPGKSRHKARQLCQQVLEVLDGALGDLAVVAVDPAPDSTHLLVTVAARASTDPIDPAAILAELSRSAARVRFEVASAITRKRVPLLTYRVVAIRSADGVGFV